jgi:hypothetical protein
MAKSTKPPTEHREPEHPEREEAPRGRETPSLGPRRGRKKVRPLEGEPAIDRAYEPGDEQANENPWQDPGGPEPANG